MLTIHSEQTWAFSLIVTYTLLHRLETNVILMVYFVQAKGDRLPTTQSGSGKKQTDKKQVDKKQADKKPTEKKTADKKPADKKPADKKPVDKKQADKKPADKKTVEKKPADKKTGNAGVSLEAGYRRYTAVFVVTNLPLTAGYCGLIFTQTLLVSPLTLTNTATHTKSY